MSPSAPPPEGDPLAPVRGGAPAATDRLLDPPDALPPSARRRLWLMGTDSGIWRIRALIVVLASLALLAFVAVGANRPGDPSFAPNPPRTPPAGFGEIAFQLTTDDGTQLGSGCAVLAGAEAQWAEGFMNKRAIPGYDAMVFRFGEPRDGAFFNKNVPITLDIAWFDAAGIYVDAARMPPCENAESCPLYRPRGPYQFAVETPIGGLGRLGAAPGTKLTLTDTCG